MKRVICDQCRKEVEPNPYGLAPDGWLTVETRGKFHSKDFCSEKCLVYAFGGAFGGVPVSTEIERTTGEPAVRFAGSADVSAKDDGGPAFPASVAEILGVATNSAEFDMPGMSLRDYFAGHALSGLMSTVADMAKGTTVDTIAADCYGVADAMLAERSKP